MTTRHNLRLIKLEAIVTFLVVGAVETVYLQTRGYTLGQIGLAHAIQTTVLLTTNIPTGYLADKVSRRTCNLIGNVMAAMGIAGLALAGSLVLIIVAKIITGTGLALSMGADAALMKAECERLNEPFAKHQASSQAIMVALMVISGVGIGMVTTDHPTAGILLCAVPYVLGAITSCFITEVKAPAEPVTRSIKKALWSCWSSEKIRWAILTGSTLGALAGVIQDLAVPLAKAGGVIPSIASGAWAYYFAAWSLGALLCKRVVDLWKKQMLLLPPVVIVAVSLAIVAIDINTWTVEAFLLVGLAHGWLAPQLTAIVAEAAPSELRATVISIYMTSMQLSFVVTTLAVFSVAATSIAYAIVVAFLLCAPPLLIASKRLIRTV